MASGVAFALSLILVIGHLQKGPGSLAKTFAFPEYPYKETTKNELLFRQFEQACEESGACKMLSQQRSDSVAKTRCIRECVSPSCYKEIYLFDQLEEGEIDVRLNSFKGCFMQRNGRPRKKKKKKKKKNKEEERRGEPLIAKTKKKNDQSTIWCTV